MAPFVDGLKEEGGKREIEETVLEGERERLEEERYMETDRKRIRKSETQMMNKSQGQIVLFNCFHPIHEKYN